MEIGNLHAAGRAAWPTIDVTHDAFAAYVADREAVAERAADLYVACACAAGDARAVAALEATHFDGVRATIGRIAPDAATADEALQKLRELLFVADGKPPGIAGYSGRGDLRAWLRVAATRVVLGLLRGRRRDTDDAELTSLAAPDASPELALLRSRYASDANAALRAALAELSVRERNLLRQHFVDGLGIDALGRVYGVHRSTAARWLERAKARFEQRTHARLIAQLGVGAETATSILAMLRSDLHVTLA